jgi:hypothetical protein
MNAGGAGFPTERQNQRAILRMVGTCFPRVLCHHSPNGAHLAGVGSAKFKQMGALKGDGLKPGFPDLILLWPVAKGCFIEVKREKTGKVSPEQFAMHETLRALGWPILVTFSVDDAFEFLKANGAPWNGIPWEAA